MISPKDKTHYNYKITDYMKLRQPLINVNWNDVYKAMDSNENVKIFLNMLRNYIVKAIKKKRPTKRKSNKKIVNYNCYH